MKNLNEQFKNVTNINDRINESIILSAIVCSACVAYAAGPLLNTEFFKSVGQGLSNALGGLGTLFGGIGSIFGGIGNKGSAPADELKNIHALLKKKPNDLTPKERKQLEEAAGKYDLSEELSENELNKLENMGISVGSTTDDTDDDETETETKKEKTTNTTIDENVTSASLLAIAAKANEKEKDPEKKAKMNSMIDIVSASTYDENGNLLSMEDRRKKMKELVGEDNWTEFEKDLNNMQKSVKEDELKAAIEETKKNLTEDDVKGLIEDQKSRAKSAADRIKTENDELKALKDELAVLKQDPEGNKDKIKEKEDAIEDKIKKSTLGKASPSTAAAAITRAKEGGAPPQSPTGNTEAGTEEKKVLDKYNADLEKLNSDYPNKDTDPEQKAKYEQKLADLNAQKDKDLDIAIEKDAKKEQDDLKAQYEKDIEGKSDEEKNNIKEKYLKDKKAIVEKYYKKHYEAKAIKKIDEETAKLNEERNKKLEKAANDEEKAKINKQYDEKIETFAAKTKEEIDDTEEHKDDDETKEGRYVVKDEEITDPETGEKKRVKTYTGPRGGKFYYPDGKPKKPENKVYLPKGKAKPKSGGTNESTNNYSSLKNFLHESIK